MGQVKRILSSEHVLGQERNYCGIELCETVHVHMGDYRIEFNTAQFEALAETFVKALSKWTSLGKPTSANFEVLAGKDLPSPPIYNNRFEVEEQVVPAVHVHMRGLSLRFPTLEAFESFADKIWEAKNNLKK